MASFLFEHVYIHLLFEQTQGPRTATLTIVLDGYNAPVSSGQFMDLVQKGFYNGMEIQR